MVKRTIKTAGQYSAFLSSFLFASFPNMHSHTFIQQTQSSCFMCESFASIQFIQANEINRFILLMGLNFATFEISIA